MAVLRARPELSPFYGTTAADEALAYILTVLAGKAGFVPVPMVGKGEDSSILPSHPP